MVVLILILLRVDFLLKHFARACCCNNATQADLLKSEFQQLRKDYCGMPINDIDSIDTELVTGKLPWQPAGIKFTQCVSGQKSAFSPLQEKLCIGSKNY